VGLNLPRQSEKARLTKQQDLHNQLEQVEGHPSNE
jgi:hypothetical protein